MSELYGKKILLLQQRMWGWRIGHFLAKKLQAEGCRLAAITFKPAVNKFTTTQKEVRYDLIISDDEAVADPGKYLAGPGYSLEEICADLGIDSIWPIVHSMRHHVHSYGDKFFYGYKQNVPDEDIVLYVKAVYKYLRRIFDEFRPDIVISPNYVAMPHILCNLFALKRGVKMIVATDCKVRGVNIFTEDFLESTGQFYDRVKMLARDDADSSNRQRARDYIAQQRQTLEPPLYSDKFKPSRSWRKRFRAELAPYKEIWRFLQRPRGNYFKTLGVTIDYRPPRIILRDHYLKKRYKKFAQGFSYTPPDRLDKFVFFPLQHQPESTIDVVAPFFSNQLEVSRLIAMALPGDYTLAVRDHPTMLGYRSPSFLEKLAHTPNVKVIDWRLPMAEILKKMSLVVSINSTAMAEAAFYNKPAIQIGSLGTTKLLPNVTVHTDFLTMPAKIKELLAADFHNEDYERRLENYVAAAFDTGFDFDYVSAWEQGKGDLEVLWKIYEKEILRVLA